MMRKTIWWKMLLWILVGNCVSNYNEGIAKDVDLLRYKGFQILKGSDKNAC